ncbi:hypothetical protein GF376_03785 [Candidatus Peregrinibacteria bacterium]|nr:hypothetical protein [Candidatus Peregrinibacteria bacterium]
MDIVIFNLIKISLIFMLGASFGSFLSVITNRIINDEKGIILGKSKCPNCNHQLHTIDLFPIFSFFFIKGKCRYCKNKIPLEYPLLEILTALIFLTNYFFLSTPAFDFFVEKNNITRFSFHFIYLNLICLILIAITFVDLKTKEIPNKFLYAWLLTCLFAPFISLQNSLISILLALIVNFIFFGGQWLISKGNWLGSGDVYFGIGIALILGFEKFMVAIFLTYLIASIVSLFLITTKTVTRKDTIPFAPFMSIGTLLSLYFGNYIYMWYLNTNIIFI